MAAFDDWQWDVQYGGDDDDEAGEGDEGEFMRVSSAIMVGWLCFTSHRQQCHLETAPPFTVPWEECESRFNTIPTGN